MDGPIWALLAVAFVSGGGLTKAMDMVREGHTGRTQRRRSEVDHMARLLAEAEARVRVAERRERIATEWGHRNAVAAIRAGVTETEMPSLDFRDD